MPPSNVQFLDLLQTLPPPRLFPPSPHLCVPNLSYGHTTCRCYLPFLMLYSVNIHSLVLLRNQFIQSSPVQDLFAFPHVVLLCECSSESEKMQRICTLADTALGTGQRRYTASSVQSSQHCLYASVRISSNAGVYRDMNRFSGVA